MTAYLAPQFDTQFFDGSTVAAGYKLYTYESGTTTPKAVYSDQAGTVPHTNPIVLDSNGRVTGQMFLGSGEYTFTLETDADVLVKTWNDVAGASTTVDDALIRSDLASTSDASKGAGMVGWFQSIAGFVARRVSYKLADRKHLKDFGAALDGATNDDAAWTAALTWAAANAPCELDCGGYGASKKTTTVLLPAGVTLNEPNLLIAANVVGMRFTGEARVRKLKLRFSGPHTNNGVDIGAVGIDAGRSVIDGADIQGAGNDGIQVRNGNLGTLRDIKSVLNGRDGINFTTETVDNNAWKLEGFHDLRGNARDGLNLTQGASASDVYAPKSNQGGLIVAQSNGRYGLYCGTRSNEFTVYAESNGTDIYIDTYAYGNEITVVQALAITDNGTGNIITTHSMNADYIRGFINQVIFSGKASKGLKISNDDGTTGTVSLQKTGANAYKLATNSSGGTHVFSFKNDDGLTYWRFYGPQLIDTAPAVASNAPTIASAGTIAPTTPIAFISGTTTINTITAPTAFANGGGQITLIPTGLWATSNAGNIAIASTAVVSKALILTYDVTTGKWYPSY